jgi:hypothetical protein
MNKIIVVDSDDWQGMYVNGTLKEEGHEVRIDDISKYTPISEIKVFCLSYYGTEELEDFGSLPNKLSEIPSDWFCEDDLDELRDLM